MGRSPQFFSQGMRQRRKKTNANNTPKRKVQTSKKKRFTSKRRSGSSPSSSKKKTMSEDLGLDPKASADAKEPTKDDAPKNEGKDAVAGKALNFYTNAALRCR